MCATRGVGIDPENIPELESVSVSAIAIYALPGLTSFRVNESPFEVDDFCGLVYFLFHF